MSDCHALEGFAWSNLERVFRLALGVFQTALMARYLGPSSFGLLSNAAALVGLAAGLATLGLDSILMRRIALQPDEAGRIMGTALGLRLISGGLVFAGYLAWIGGDVVPASERAVVGIVALTSITQALAVFDSWYKGHTKQKQVAWSQIAAFMAALALRMIGIGMGAGLWYFALVVVLEAGLGGCLLALGWLRSQRIRLAPLDGRTALSLMAESWPQIVAGVAVAICMRFDLVLVARLLGANEAGEYAAAVRISELIQFMPVALVSVLAPTLLRLRERDHLEYERALAGLLALSLWAGLLVSGALCSMAGLGTLMIFGERYHASASILRIHCWSNVTVFVGTTWSVYWLAERRQGVSMLITIAGALAAIAATLLLVPSIGSHGAAAATLCGQLVPFVALLLWTGPRRLLAEMGAAFLHPLVSARRTSSYLYTGRGNT
ncbi:MAG: flippase [Opitutaceae bacterium]